MGYHTNRNTRNPFSSFKGRNLNKHCDGISINMNMAFRDPRAKGHAQIWCNEPNFSLYWSEGNGKERIEIPN